MFKKLITIATITIAVLVAVPANADHRNKHSYNNHYNNNGYYNNHRGNNNRWHQPRRQNHRQFNGYYNSRNNDLAGIIIGGVILNELFRNNRRRHVQQCYDVRNYYIDHYGNRVEYFQRQCN